MSPTGHWTRVLQCRQRCVGDVATRPGRSLPVPDFLPTQLRRLHEAHAQGQLGGRVSPRWVDWGWDPESEGLSLMIPGAPPLHPSIYLCI